MKELIQKIYSFIHSFIHSLTLFNVEKINTCNTNLNRQKNNNDNDKKSQLALHVFLYDSQSSNVYFSNSAWVFRFFPQLNILLEAH